VNCQELIAVLLDYIGGELVVEQITTVEIHIAGCPDCDILVHTYRHTVRLARVMKCCPLPTAIEARLRAAVEAALKPGEAK